MTRLTTLPLVIVTLGALLAAGAAQAAQPGASCGSGSSAINQYCENLPSANGHGTPAPGAAPEQTPSLATALSQSAVRAIARLPAGTRKRARKLLAIPAPAPRVPLTASITANGSAASFPIGVVIALLAIAAAGAGAALARRRRRKSA